MVTSDVWVACDSPALQLCEASPSAGFEQERVRRLGGAAVTLAAFDG
jgi:hypothetical protein